MEATKNRAFELLRAHLAAYSDGHLLDMLDALADGKGYPPVWHAPLPRHIIPLVVPTLYAELLRRHEVAELEQEA